MDMTKLIRELSSFYIKHNLKTTQDNVKSRAHCIICNIGVVAYHM